MARTRRLIIPDVHENIDVLERALARFLPQVDGVTLLGDYFDRGQGSDRQNLRRICGFLREALVDKRFDCGLGNHDISYLFPDDHFRCSGFNLETLQIIEQELPPPLRAKLADPRGRVARMHNGWLLSHAGLHPNLVPLTGWSMKWFDGVVEEARTRLLAPAGPRQHWLWEAGYDRGGRARFGGPLWLDWNTFTDASKVLPRQIVGHTRGKTVRRKGRSFCLDTGMAYVGLLETDGSLTFEPTSQQGSTKSRSVVLESVDGAFGR